MMARGGAAETFGTTVGDSLTWCEPEEVEYKMNIELVNVIMDPSSISWHLTNLKYSPEVSDIILQHSQ